jgi:hypothetical protein
LHGTTPPETTCVTCSQAPEVAAARVGEFWIDDHMRNIPDHFHAHARPRAASSDAERSGAQRLRAT